MYFGYKNISIKYGQKDILREVNISFNKGEISTIIGQNGCGKSSLLRILSNAVKPIGGEVIFNNKSIKDYNRKDIAKKIGILPQVHTAPGDISVETLVSYGRYPHKKRGMYLNSGDEQVIAECLEMMGLTHLRKQSLETLSGGERQRAWIAMTLAQQPDILILDEPTTYLDITYQIEILSLIEELNKKLGLTVIMVLHDLNLAARYSHQIYVIKDEQIFVKGTPKEVLTETLMEDVFKLKTSIHEDIYGNCPYFLAQYSLNQKAYKGDYKE